MLHRATRPLSNISARACTSHLFVCASVNTCTLNVQDFESFAHIHTTFKSLHTFSSMMRARRQIRTRTHSVLYCFSFNHIVVTLVSVYDKYSIRFIILCNKWNIREDKREQTKLFPRLIFFRICFGVLPFLFQLLELNQLLT